MGHSLGVELQGIVASVDEGCPYESRADVGDGNGKMAHAGLLGETFEVMALKPLGGRIGWRGAKALGPGYGRDASNATRDGMSRDRLAVAGTGKAAFFGKPVEGRVDHSHEANAVGLHGLQLLVDVKLAVLPTDA